MGNRFDTINNSLRLTGNTSTTALTGDLSVSGGIVPSTPFGMRNRIINGAMDVWQRGTSFSSPGNVTYLADRWFVGIGGSNITSATQVAGPSGFRYAMQLTGGAGNSVTQFNQRIESVNTYDLVGKSVTIQANIQVSSSQNVAWALYYANSVDNFNALTSISSGTWSATTTATTFTATINNLPASAANGLMVLISPNGGGAFTSGTITITGVQLEAGTVATPFERRQFGTELALCQRYFQTNPRAIVFGISGSFYTYNHVCPVAMRATPSVSLTTTSPYFESIPWTTVGSWTSATVDNGHMFNSGGDIRLGGTFNVVNTFAEIGASIILISAEL